MRIEHVAIWTKDFEKMKSFYENFFNSIVKEKVNELTDRLKKEGFQVLDGPRTTGDGYYESVVLDPEMNRLEITI
ncbi:MAG: VOC family protein [Candidatus Pristimantibacillus sp.]